MTHSLTCTQQRQKETEKTRKLVTIGVVGSIAFHGVALSMMNYIEKPLAKEENKPIEFIIIQEPEPKQDIKQEKPKLQPEKPIPKTQLKEVEPSKPQTTPTVKANSPKSQVIQSLKTNIPKPKPTETIEPTLSPQEIIQPIKTPTPIATESNPIKPQFNTPNSTPQIEENTAPLLPQEVLTSNTLARNNIPRAPKPVENQNSSNSWSNSFKSSPRAVNNNTNQETFVASMSENVGVSSGRLSRNNNKTPSTINGSNGNQGEGIGNLRNSFSRGNSNSNSNGIGNGNKVSGIPSNVAATSQSVPQRPQAKLTPPPPESIKCIRNCDPVYPSELQGVEGKTTVKVNLDSGGNVLGVNVVNPHSNGEVNRQALLAARQMRFSSPSVNNASVQVSINFTVAGSEFDRLARQKKEEQQRQARLAQDKERQARQAQLEKERLQRQQQLEKERQERERLAQIEREKTEQQLRQSSSPINTQTNINNSENLPLLELDEKLDSTLLEEGN
ncbi:hypothetical protein GM3708_2560 [Geminocystis sp. NIES-3708]|uniref:energy transducer TonB family protein n=1 Tax=Geminocystis sp. NIES-3708 TaxID=1615909 RepID=UPI0005FC50E7|nr:energy transducer TonB [Geminocystis sp. NIES-3708]BAQ62154.1 hypothetical protein GM3708_2560 [Geminocystis sp. NIES-3708]